ncbi:hypothetical protein CK203_100114 [Vitis vinifera]|uniref:Uncharacterized protein n=1 Tax=Vitis vinifera TaxID=29760 RepID=A0A438C7L1_VITVI|nr:hypothetical protein CK203_100114 [Vitis vinifera]
MKKKKRRHVANLRVRFKKSSASAYPNPSQSSLLTLRSPALSLSTQSLSISHSQLGGDSRADEVHSFLYQEGDSHAQHGSALSAYPAGFSALGEQSQYIIHDPTSIRHPEHRRLPHPTHVRLHSFRDSGSGGNHGSESDTTACSTLQTAEGVGLLRKAEEGNEATEVEARRLAEEKEVLEADKRKAKEEAERLRQELQEL